MTEAKTPKEMATLSVICSWVAVILWIIPWETMFSGTMLGLIGMGVIPACFFLQVVSLVARLYAMTHGVKMRWLGILYGLAWLGITGANLLEILKAIFTPF